MNVWIITGEMHDGTLCYLSAWGSLARANEALPYYDKYYNVTIHVLPLEEY